MAANGFRLVPATFAPLTLPLASPPVSRSTLNAERNSLGFACNGEHHRTEPTVAQSHSRTLSGSADGTNDCSSAAIGEQSMPHMLACEYI
eukprot:7448134-Pyramimonas_sp.AAC.2